MRSFVLSFLFSAFLAVNADPAWNDLQVTFGINAFSSKYFVSLPRSFDDILSGDYGTWNIITSSYEDCTNGGKYNGYRMIFEDDPSISLLFDIQGSIAGIQMNINQSSVKVPGNNYRFDKVSMYLEDNIKGLPVYTLTAYVVDPSTICTTGRDSATIETVGTGTGLWLQNGPNPSPSNLIVVPHERPLATSQGWTQNHCFVAMGYHNFYESLKYQDSMCTEYRPAFLLFQEEQGFLHGFGFAAAGKAYSKNARYENPDSKAINMIVGKELVSQCLLDQADTIGVTTMHVYFRDNNKLGHSCM